ncbi:MAG: DUF4339 domain-containing protein [Planctomycetaceae bacterium]
MKKNWYTKVKGGVEGPFSEQELVAMLKTGSLLPGTLVRQGINGGWRELREGLANLGQDEGSSEAARQALVIKHRPAVGSRSQTGSSPSVSRFSIASQLVGRLAGSLGDRLAGVAVWIGDHVTRRRVLVAGLLLGFVMLIRASPLMDTSLSGAIADVDRVWLEAEGLRDAEAGEKDWEEFQTRSLKVLNPISDSLVKANERPPGVWGLLWSTSESEIEARHDLIQLARNELPASLTAGLDGNEVHDQRIEVCLDRLRSYNEGQNPYGLAVSLEDVPSDATDPWVSVIVGADVLIACVCGWWWFQRRHA